VDAVSTPKRAHLVSRILLGFCDLKTVHTGARLPCPCRRSTSRRWSHITLSWRSMSLDRPGSGCIRGGGHTMGGVDAVSTPTLMNI
jgi:hypothetical protein